MHFYFYARGINSQVEVWKTLMQNQFFVWERKDLVTGQIEKKLVQGALRPSIFGAWEYVFPEDCLSEVLSLMGVSTGGGWYIQKTGIFFLRHAFGAKAIPKKALEEAAKLPNTIAIEGRKRAFYHAIVKGVIIHPIGIKADREGEMLGFQQELL